MDAVKNVLFISYDGMTDPLGQSQVLPYLKGLSERGFSITLISCEKKLKFAQHKATIDQICKNANIDWQPIKYTKRPPLLSTLKDIRAIGKLAKRLHKEKNFQIVHCRSYIAMLIGMQLKKRFGVKLLFDMRGFWADERVEGNIWSLSNPIFKLSYQFFKRKEREFLTQSDHIISLTENGKQELLTWAVPDVNESKITVIPCCVDLELFDPSKISNEEKVTKKQALNIQPNDHVIGYIGSIGTWYLLPEMLHYFKALQRTIPNAKFLFVTGEEPILIQQEAYRHQVNLEDIIITSCLHKEVPLHISIMNESIFFINPTFSKKASSPTKQGEIMAMGIPLVCNSGVGDTDRIVKMYQAGKIVEDLNDDHYRETLVQPNTFDQKMTIQGAQAYFSLATGVTKYAKVYTSMATKWHIK